LNVQRVLRNTGSDIQIEFYVNGTLTDPDGEAGTITVRKADGTVLAGPSPITRVSQGKYKYALAPQASLNSLSATWAATFGGVSNTVTTYVDVVGAHLFTEAQAREFDGGAMASDTKYPDSAIAKERDRITDLLEENTGVSWIPRFGRATLDGNDRCEIQLPHVQVLKVLSVKVDGTAFTSDELNDLVPYPDGGLVRKQLGTWPKGHRNIVVEYEHGHERTVDGVDRIALLWLRRVLVKTNIPDAVTSYTDQEGNTYRVGVAGAKRPSGVFEIDAWINRHDETEPVVA
jgi:hypothetical protein